MSGRLEMDRDIRRRVWVLALLCDGPAHPGEAMTEQFDVPYGLPTRPVSGTLALGLGIEQAESAGWTFTERSPNGEPHCPKCNALQSAPTRKLDL